MSRIKSSSSKRPHPTIGLFMECEDEELTLAQREFYGKIKNEHQMFNEKLNDYIKQIRAEVVLQEGDCSLFQVNKSCSYLNLIGASRGDGDYPAGTLQTTGQSPAPQKTSTRGRPRKIPPSPGTQPSTATAKNVRTALATQITAAPPSPVSSSLVGRKTIKTPLVQEKPCETSAIGGLTVGSKTLPKNLILSGEGDVDSKELVIGKAPGKTYPSLTIVSRPHLQLKPSLINQGQIERNNLDVQVKGVLMYSAAKFTEWLIQQGLVRSEQCCSTHVTPNGLQVPLKLGMYSEVSKFPYSGGYVWISDCCPSQFVSVFYGSLFEGSPHVPNVILKLMYHWACQTNVPNVIQWVKVDASYVRNIYTLLRAVCVLSVNEKSGLLGFRGKNVQVGSIILGSTSQEGSLRHVKIEVIGVLEVETKKIRLQAVDTEGKQGKRRLMKLLQVLRSWVDPESTLLCDLTMDKSVLQSLGFSRVQAVADGNKEVMGYLRRVVPRLFQSTLPLISKAIVQQFLDELVWRERWGPIAAHAFNNLMVHLADLTRSSKEENLLKRLVAAASDPFSAVSSTLIPTTTMQIVDESSKRGRKREADRDISAAAPLEKKRIVDCEGRQNQEGRQSFWKVQPFVPISPEISSFFSSHSTVAVDSFYYGTLQGDDAKIIDLKPADVVSIKCCICLKPFLDCLALMKHILLHCQIKPLVRGPLRKIHQCSQCFLGYPTAAALRSHINDVHSPPEHQKHLICLICDKLFGDRVQFLFHMHHTHVPMELPYACQVCGHRSSTYSAMTEHLTQAHCRGHHIFCPYCLKTVGLTRKNVSLAANVIFFVNHIQRHQRQLENQCHRCRLSYVSPNLLQNHLEQDHASFQYCKTVRPFQSSNSMVMPEPGNLIKPALLPQLSKPDKKPGSYSVKHFSAPIQIEVDSRFCCAECEGDLDSPNHFVGEVRCSSCKFISCCEQAVSEHFSVYHDTSTPVALGSGKPVAEVPTMFCSCGFFSSSANTLAKHLVSCGKITAYPGELQARAASRVMFSESNSMIDGSEPHMLNMLGLVRVSPEPSSTQEVHASKQEVIAMDVSSSDDGFLAKKDKLQFLHNTVETRTEECVTEFAEKMPIDTKTSTEDTESALPCADNEVFANFLETEKEKNLEDLLGSAKCDNEINTTDELGPLFHAPSHSVTTCDVPVQTTSKSPAPSCEADTIPDSQEDLKSNLCEEKSMEKEDNSYCNIQDTANNTDRVMEPDDVLKYNEPSIHPGSEKEVEGCLIKELEEIMNSADQTDEAPDFIENLINPE